MTGNTPFVIFENVTFKRGNRKIFDNISLSIPVGKVITIMGPSGTGKTTFLRLICGQIKPDSGRVIVDGQVVNELSRAKLFELRRRMSLLFQSSALFTNLNVFDNVAYPLRERPNLSEAIIRNIVLMKLEAVGLRGAVDLMPAELSGGMARRVALARSIAADPALIMYDEPFTGQDPISVATIIKLVKLLNETMGMTSIVVTHDVHLITKFTDYAYVLAGGRIVSEGEPEALFQQDSPEVKQFLQGLSDGPVPFHFPAKAYSQDLLGEDNNA